LEEIARLDAIMRRLNQRMAPVVVDSEGKAIALPIIYDLARLARNKELRRGRQVYGDVASVLLTWKGTVTEIAKARPQADKKARIDAMDIEIFGPELAAKIAAKTVGFPPAPDWVDDSSTEISESSFDGSPLAAAVSSSPHFAPALPGSTPPSSPSFTASDDIRPTPLPKLSFDDSSVTLSEEDSLDGLALAAASSTSSDTGSSPPSSPLSLADSDTLTPSTFLGARKVRAKGELLTAKVLIALPPKLPSFFPNISSDRFHSSSKIVSLKQAIRTTTPRTRWRRRR